MARNLPSLMITEITSDQVALAYLVDLQLVSGTVHVWTGIGSLTWNGNTYGGVGSLGSVGEISESSAVRADGTAIGLSGIDPTLLGDSLTDIQQGAPAMIWLAAISNGAILTAYKAFVGTVDKPSVQIGAAAIAIQIALETKMANLQRPTMRRYTAADQRVYFPTDSGFNWVEILNDIALIWG